MSLQILDLACRRVFESRLLGRELAFGISDPYQRFSGEAWSLLIALVLVGLLPNSPKWLMMIEEQLRGWVHTWFLVPDGVVKTIGILEDARYDPPANQLNAVASPLRERLQEDLRLPSNSFHYRWARARMLIESLKQMGNGSPHPLKKAAFAPFSEDFESLRYKCRALAQDIGISSEPMNDEKEEALGIRQ